MVHPAEEAPGGILRERIARFMRPDRNVGMADGSGWDKDGGARGELNYKLEIP